MKERVCCSMNIELYRNLNITSKLDENISKALEVVRKSTTIEKC